jgi:phosphoribosylamine--glycine ligase
MKILLVGGGGREHALAWRLEREGHALVAAPGNPGIARHARCIATDALDVEALVTLAVHQRVDLVVVGPEAPLARGLVDALHAAAVPAFGPGAAAARLESSKAFAKEFMAQHAVPTAEFRVVTTIDAADDAVRAFGFPVVLKADGLAAGKGVVVAADVAEAHGFARACLEDARLGAAGASLVVERFLPGSEASLFYLVDGERAWAFPPARDYKRLLAGDRGPNTGGMGALAPAPLAPGLAQRVEAEVVLPTLAGMAKRGQPYRGLLYVGLMIGPDGPRVLEYNARFGDPETQALLPLVDGGLGEALRECAVGRLVHPPRMRDGECAVGVVLAAPGYPAAAAAPAEVRGLAAWPDPDAEDAEARWAFHAGTRHEGSRILSAGGRVLSVVARDRDFTRARERAYAGLARLDLSGGQWRADVAAEFVATGAAAERE